MPAQQTITLEHLAADVEIAAGLADVAVDTRRLRPILEAFRLYFTGSAVSMRTSTRPKARRGLNLRFVELERATDPYPIALERGFIRSGGHPIEKLLPEVQAAFPILGYGVDVGVSTGLEKIWPFFPHRPQTLQAVSELTTIPPSVRAYRSYFAGYGLDDVALFALDYTNRTLNLYFMRPPGTFSPTGIAAMIGDLGLVVPDDDLLRRCASAVPIYFTFAWDSPRIERACFGVIAPEMHLLPLEWDPLIRRFALGVPFASDRRSYIYSVTLTHDEVFVKIENDYSGTMTSLMQVPF